MNVEFDHISIGSLCNICYGKIKFDEVEFFDSDVIIQLDLIYYLFRCINISKQRHHIIYETHSKKMRL